MPQDHTDQYHPNRAASLDHAYNSHKQESQCQSCYARGQDHVMSDCLDEEGR